MRVINNGEYIDDTIHFHHITVFLVGPSARSTGSQSYRAGLLRALAERDDTENMVVFDPEGGEYDATRGHEYAQWELRALDRSLVILLGMTMNDTDMPGLTTRAETGALLQTRRALVMYAERGAHRINYLVERARAAGIDIITRGRYESSMDTLASSIMIAYRHQCRLIDRAFHENYCLDINAKLDLVHIEVAVHRLYDTHGKKMRVTLPLLPSQNYAHALRRFEWSMDDQVRMLESYTLAVKM